MIHKGLIIVALARYFDWFHNTMMTEWWIDYGIADVLFITRSGYATEIEIKMSLSDWKADLVKEKWGRQRPSIARFFYAVPESLVDKEPPGIPPEHGLIAISMGSKGYPRARVVREAKRLKASKISDHEIRRMFASCYHRFWGAEIKRRMANR